MSSLQIEPRHQKIVQEILDRYGIHALAFGSRAKGTAKPFSDLDLCLKGSYEKSVVRKLQDAFEESDLPYKVDVVLWSEISESFQRNIEKDLVEFSR